MDAQIDMPLPGASLYAAHNAELKRAKESANTDSPQPVKKQKDTSIQKGKKKARGEPPSEELKLWEAFVHGEVPDIESVAKREEIRRAYKHFFKRVTPPTVEVLLEAYREHMTLGASNSLWTQAWIDFEEERAQTGRKLWLLRDSDMPRPLPGPQSPVVADPPQGPPADTYNGGVRWTPGPVVYPTLESAKKTMDAWFEGDAEYRDKHVSEMRMARIVLGNDVIRRTKGSVA